MEKGKKTDGAKLGAQERLEAILAAAEGPDTFLRFVAIPASTVALGQAGSLVREVLAQTKAEKVAALREIADVIESGWARLGTRTLILKTIRDRATVLEADLLSSTTRTKDVP